MSSLENKNAISLLIAAMKRNRNMRLMAGCFFSLSGVCIAFIFSKNLPPATELTLQIAGGIVLAGGVYAVIAGLRKFNVKKHRLVLLLSEKPEEIVWIYPYIVISMPYGIEFMRMGTLYFNLIDGKRISLRVKEKDINPIMDGLKEYLPHATFGHSIKKEQLYRANPALLVRDDNPA